MRFRVLVAVAVGLCALLIAAWIWFLWALAVALSAMVTVV